MATETSGKSVTREAIVSKAVDLMGERGLAAVSLRRIATELGVSAPTLYWYIASKRELLDSVAEYLLRKGWTGMANRPADGQPWWDWLEERARAMFLVMTSVRDAPQVVAGNRPTLDRLQHVDTALGELVAVGFPADEAQQIFFVLGGYVGGMALEWQSEASREQEGADDSALGRAITDADRFPHLAAAAAGKGHRSPMSTFDYGLELLIRGLRARHEELW
ncbi:TetR/AcrR family transcriptional regulator C-terminal domain-containing protein [Prauserella flavalba]|uniref:Transcriptional regulator n=1 Tax=Prauserella flavalba TaxID=1477506 RepID=A0A318M5Z5_9PSEU|nr:TetR/AcrR family transcriptional regulator C-terminal domain-containing protein [Prauserella flavalba]PXY38206.1 transcriptional regulator [Prauserella flavalba]